jgi:hypothetical protein
MQAPRNIAADRPPSIVFHSRGPQVEAPSALACKEHLLKVAAASSRDAAQIWDQLWVELRRYQAAHGTTEHDGQPGFMPSMGWRDFFDKFEELRHLIDSVERICTHQ